MPHSPASEATLVVYLINLHLTDSKIQALNDHHLSLRWWSALAVNGSNHDHRRCAPFLKTLNLIDKSMVGRDRIELSTHGFSVHCSTD